MSVLFTMQVGPVEWDKFKAASDWGYSQKPAGLISGKVYRGEGDPSKVLVVEEWETHVAWHEFAERVGSEFNSRAGTEGANWQNRPVWVLSDAATYG